MTFELKEEHINAGAMILVRIKIPIPQTLLMICVNRI